MTRWPHAKVATFLDNSARKLLRECGKTAPPYDPWQIAAHLDVPVSFSGAAVGVDGYVEVSFGNKLRIILNSDAPESRQRFTLAHELGHVVLMKECLRDRRVVLTRYRAGIPPAGTSCDRTEERLCNRFAANLLMPVFDMTDYWREKPMTPTALRDCASLFAVSLMAAANRVRDSGLATHVSYWDREPWPMRRWKSRNAELPSGLKRRIREVVDTLSRPPVPRVRRNLEEEIVDHGVVIRASDCGKSSILVTVSRIDRDRVSQVLASASRRREWSDAAQARLPGI